MLNNILFAAISVVCLASGIAAFFYLRKRHTLKNAPKTTLLQETPPVSMIVPDGQLVVFSLHKADVKDIPYAWAMLTLPEDSDKEGVLWMIYTREMFRGQGHATALVKYLQTQFKYLMTHYEKGLVNSAGTKLLMKCGFRLKPAMYKRVPSELVWKAR